MPRLHSESSGTRVVFLLLVPLFVCLIPAVARSQATIDQLTRGAGVIVEGQVAAVDAAWNADHTRIYTTVRLDVARFHKGDAGQKTLDIRLLGGTVGDMALVVVGQPTFTPGESVFLFLNPNFEARDVPVVGRSDGIFRVTIDALGREALVSPTGTFTRGDVVTTIRNVMQPIGQ